MSRIAAVLGTKGGWLVLRESPLPGPWGWFVSTSFDNAMQRLESYDVVAVDVPLSLAEAPARETTTDDVGIHDKYRRPAQKIVEVHDYMRNNPGSAHSLYEVHPRLSFLALECGDQQIPANGHKVRFRDRLSYLCDVFPAGILREALTSFARTDASKIDILDAFAMLWSAKRIATSRAKRLPSLPVLDARGFDMAIWY